MSTPPLSRLKQQRAECKRLDSARDAADAAPYQRPAGADAGTRVQTKRRLERLARTPLLRLLIEDTAQRLVLEGITSDDHSSLDSMWAPWEANAMPSRQGALYEAMLSYGEVYAIVDPSTDGRAVVTMATPRTIVVLNRDHLGQPERVARFPRSADPGHAEIIEARGRTTVPVAPDGTLAYDRAEDDGAPALDRCPVIAYQAAPSLDDDPLEGSLIDRLRQPAARHRQSVHVRLMAQHYNSWKVRTATGLDAASKEDADETKRKLENSDILAGPTGSSFGTLDETSISPLLEGERQDLAMLAAIAQKPAWALAATSLTNLSADALAEAAAAERLRTQALQRRLGRAHLDLLRACAALEGRTADARRYDLHAQWADTEARSLAQSADALGKLATMLSVPPELLWGMIPGVSEQRAEDWRSYLEDHPRTEEALLRSVMAQDEAAAPSVQD